MLINRNSWILDPRAVPCRAGRVLLGNMISNPLRTPMVRSDIAGVGQWIKWWRLFRFLLVPTVPIVDIK